MIIFADEEPTPALPKGGGDEDEDVNDNDNEDDNENDKRIWYIRTMGWIIP